MHPEPLSTFNWIRDTITECETALFHILKYADIPQACGLIFPRRTILTGKKSAGLQWTKALYGDLGAGESFVEHEGAVTALLNKIKNAPMIQR